MADDYDHRLTAGSFAKILQLGDKVLPHDAMKVEVEYDCCVVARYPIASADFSGQHIEIQLGEKHTACLARERRDAADACCGTREPAAAGCC